MLFPLFLGYCTAPHELLLVFLTIGYETFSRCQNGRALSGVGIFLRVFFGFALLIFIGFFLLSFQAYPHGFFAKSRFFSSGTLSQNTFFHSRMRPHILSSSLASNFPPTWPPMLTTLRFCGRPLYSLAYAALFRYSFPLGFPYQYCFPLQPTTSTNPRPKTNKSWFFPQKWIPPLFGKDVWIIVPFFTLL